MAAESEKSLDDSDEFHISDDRTDSIATLDFEFTRDQEPFRGSYPYFRLIF